MSVVFFLSPYSRLPNKLEALLANLRSSFPWKFSYHFIGYTNIYTYYNGARNNIYLRRFKPKKLLDKQNSLILIKMYEKAYGLKLTDKSRNFVIANTGGNPGLIKSLAFQQNKDATNTIDFTDQDLIERITNIITILPRNIVLELIGKKKITAKDKRFLKMFGYFNKLDNFFAPWIIDWLLVDKSMREYIKVLELTPQQQNVYEFFKNNKGRLITRQELARFLWGNDYINKYSDWAIDRLITDIRYKLKDIIKIETKKRRGFIIY